MNPALLRSVQTAGTVQQQVDEAVRHGLFALAALAALRAEAATDVSHASRQRVVRGLAQFHPRLTPVNFVALRDLERHMRQLRARLDIDSVDKLQLITSLLRFGDPALVHAGFALAARTGGAPLPTSALAALARLARTAHVPDLAAAVWSYLREHYTLALPRHGPVLFDLMHVFANSHAHAALARDVARAALTNDDLDPLAAAGAALVSYKLRDPALREELTAVPSFRPTRRTDVAGQLLQLAESPSASGAESLEQRLPLLESERASVVKLLASTDVEAARGALERATRAGKDTAALVALANEYIERGNRPPFEAAMRTLAERGLSGVRLNLRLKWEQRHGSYAHARRHFQNAETEGGIPLKQRRIAEALLGDMANRELGASTRGADGNTSAADDAGEVGDNTSNSGV